MIKRAIVLFIFNFIFLSCSYDDEETLVTNLKAEVEIAGEWKLVKMTGNFENSETTGDDMYWQENYIFHDDGTFLKTRFFENETFQFPGNYDTEEVEDNEFYDSFITLSYPVQNNIIASCYSTRAVEHLMLAGPTLISTYNACDGPGLYYKKVK